MLAPSLAVFVSFVPGTIFDDTQLTSSGPIVLDNLTTIGPGIQAHGLDAGDWTVGLPDMFIAPNGMTSELLEGFAAVSYPTA